MRLVDFGFATRYMDECTGKHIIKQEVQTFRGNMMFSSAYQMDFKTTSRRDDIISLLYLLVYLLNQGSLLGFTPDEIETKRFLGIKRAKMTHDIK